MEPQPTNESKLIIKGKCFKDMTDLGAKTSKTLVEAGINSRLKRSKEKDDAVGDGTYSTETDGKIRVGTYSTKTDGKSQDGTYSTKTDGKFQDGT